MARLIVGVNDLLTTHPKLAEEWNYEKNGTLLPSEITAGSSKKVWWKCSTCGNEWRAIVYSRKNGSGCPSCSRIKQAISFRKRRVEKKRFIEVNSPASVPRMELRKEWRDDAR